MPVASTSLTVMVINDTLLMFTGADAHHRDAQNQCNPPVICQAPCLLHELLVHETVLCVQHHVQVVQDKLVRVLHVHNEAKLSQHHALNSDQLLFQMFIRLRSITQRHCQGNEGARMSATSTSHTYMPTCDALVNRSPRALVAQHFASAVGGRRQPAHP